MDKYIDGFLLCVPKANLDTYKKMATHAEGIWREHGALDYREGVADDIDGEGFASFSAAAGAREGEVVVFAWILYPSKEARNSINAKVMSDPRLAEMCCEGVFDVKRMCWGGFATLVGN